MTSRPLTTSTNEDSDTPEAYQIGWVPFLSTKIYLDSHPLIPRTETEWWCEQAIAAMKGLTTPHVLDLFSGSGCVGVAVLYHVPQAFVDFGELEARHLSTIEKNITLNSDGSRTRVFQTDIWSNVPSAYDVVLANPPYLATSRNDRIEASVLKHEPHEALYAADDGYDLIQRTIDGLFSHLRPGGQCWIEHEPEHTARISVSARKLGLTATVHKDQYGVERYSVIL